MRLNSNALPWKQRGNIPLANYRSKFNTPTSPWMAPYLEKFVKRIISLGAGVQSSTLLFLAAQGEITPMPDAAIFADTGDEPQSVYKWLDWLKAQDLPFPIITARRPITLGQNMEALANSSIDNIVVGSTGTAPLFTVNPDGSHGMLNRHCTSNHKIIVLQNAAKKRFGQSETFESWVGISTDESQRMKPSRHKAFTNRFPLAMELGMSRQDCLSWMEANGYPKPPRSACIYCPFHSDSEWLHLKTEEPAEFQKAIEFERKITYGLRGTNGERFYLHASRVPLDQVQFKNENQLDLWGLECEGMCGV